MQPKNFSVRYLFAGIGTPAAVPGTVSGSPPRHVARDCSVLLSLSEESRRKKDRKRERKKGKKKESTRLVQVWASWRRSLKASL